MGLRASAARVDQGSTSLGMGELSMGMKSWSCLERCPPADFA
jgi:hypothetical protein